LLDAAAKARPLSAEVQGHDRSDCGVQGHATSMAELHDRYLPPVELCLPVTTGPAPGDISTGDIVPGAPAQPSPVRAQAGSLAGNSLARLVSDIWALLTSLVAATVTARLLGPAGKGFYSSLVLLAGAFAQVFGAGLGEAAVVLTARGRFSLQTAASATVAYILPLSAAGALLFTLTASLTLRPGTSDQRTAVLVGGLFVAVMVLDSTALWFLLGQERVVWASGLSVLMATVTTGSLVVLMGAVGLQLKGAILASLAGAVVVLAGAWVMLRLTRLKLRPRRALGFLRPAARLGVQLQLSSLLVTLTARVDLVFVYRLAGAAAAGNYSVALTIGAMVGAIPTALAYASFARMAWAEEDDARALTAQLFRMGMITAVFAAAVLALLTPIVVPLAFGTAFRGAVTPTLLLVPAGVLWSGQWILCRAAAARGEARALSTSFAASFVVMVTLDLVLISGSGAVGAAVASLIASGTGFAISVLYYRAWGWRLKEFVPRSSDLKDLTASMRRLVTLRPRPDPSPLP